MKTTMTAAVGDRFEKTGSRRWSSPNGRSGIDRYKIVVEVTRVDGPNADWTRVETLECEMTSDFAQDLLIPDAGGFSRRFVVPGFRSVQ